MSADDGAYGFGSQEVKHMSKEPYLLAGSAHELDRLRVQAKVFEPATELWLDEIGIEPGWRCIDLGCGALGVIGPLARRAGPSGHVVGLDFDEKLLAAAGAFVTESGLGNIELLQGDAFATGLPAASFDFVHVRFLLAPLGRDDDLLREMYRLTRPGGVIGIQEPDSDALACWPRSVHFETLKRAILAAFRSGGGDFDAGRRTFGMLRGLGLEHVRLRATVVGLHGAHPYMRVPIQFASSLRSRIIDGGVLKTEELDAAIAGWEREIPDPETTFTSFVVTQVSGRKPR
jgi:SAM-dependent methyltransferase